MLIWIKFSIMRNMIMNDEFKQFREIVENRNGSVIVRLEVFTAVIMQNVVF
jgi:hypothetical protein